MGLFKSIIKGILIGGGTVLSLLCPAAGGAVVTAGMKIGAGAVAAGELIKTPTPVVSVDNVTNAVTGWLAKMGLTKPVGNGISGGFALTTNAWLLILAVVAAIVLIFKRKRA